MLILAQQATHAVEYAFKAGYNHIDSAAAYGMSQVILIAGLLSLMSLSVQEMRTTWAKR